MKTLLLDLFCELVFSMNFCNGFHRESVYIFGHVQSRRIFGQMIENVPRFSCNKA